MQGSQSIQELTAWCAVCRAVLSPSGRVCFQAPGCVVYQYDLGPVMLQNDLLAVPAGPGRSVAYTLGLSNASQVSNWQLVKTLVTNPKQLMPLLFRYERKCGSRSNGLGHG